MTSRSRPGVVFAVLAATIFLLGCDETHEIRFNNKTSLELTIAYSVEKEGNPPKTEREGTIPLAQQASGTTGSVIFFPGRFLRVKAFSSSNQLIFEEVYSYSEIEAEDFSVDITPPSPP